MSRKLASVVTIESVEPIPDTERLSVATMHGKGWKVVVGRNDFKPGDWAVYFEIDSYLPDEERYAFLRDRCLRKFCTKGGEVLKQGLRIKTIKLRGVISQGLLMPFRYFTELYTSDGLRAVNEGDDVTERLGVEHFDEVKAALAPAMGNPISAESAGSFPSYVPKTDEERCLSGDTVVVTDAGALRIKDIVERGLGKHVLSYDIAAGEEVMKPISSRTKSEKSDGWLKITLENGVVLKCTENHRIFIPGIGAFRPAGKLVEGDYVMFGQTA